MSANYNTAVQLFAPHLRPLRVLCWMLILYPHGSSSQGPSKRGVFKHKNYSSEVLLILVPVTVKNGRPPRGPGSRTEKHLLSAVFGC